MKVCPVKVLKEHPSTIYAHSPPVPKSRAEGVHLQVVRTDNF